MKPPTPWIGSAMKPAIRPRVVVRISSSMSCAQRTSQIGIGQAERAAIAVRVVRVDDAGLRAGRAARCPGR